MWAAGADTPSVCLQNEGMFGQTGSLCWDSAFTTIVGAGNAVEQKQTASIRPQGRINAKNTQIEQLILMSVWNMVTGRRLCLESCLCSLVGDWSGDQQTCGVVRLRGKLCVRITTNNRKGLATASPMVLQGVGFQGDALQTFPFPQQLLDSNYSPYLINIITKGFSLVYISAKQVG